MGVDALRKERRELDMCSGPILKGILAFAIPIMIMNLLQLLFNAADTIVVGRFNGKEAMAAVGATGSLVNLLVNLFMGLSVGASVVVAQEYGARSQGGVTRAVHTSMTLSIIGGVTVMLLGLFLSRPMLELMGTPEDILDLSSLYLRIYFIGMPANLVYNFGAAILRAVGDSRRPMIFLSVSGCVNVVLNIIFVACLNMSVAGVAWATVISQYLSALLVVGFMIRSESAVRLSLRHLRVHKEAFVRIVRIGVPAGLQGMLFSLSNVLVQSAVNSFGSTMVAAATAASNIQGLTDTANNALYNSAISFTGQNVGAQRFDRVKGIAWACSMLVMACWVLICGALLLFGRQLLSIYTSDPEVIELGMTRLVVMNAVYFTGAFMSVIPGLSRGMGQSFAPMMCTLIGACLFRVIWIMTVFAWWPTIVCLYLCYPVSWTITAIGQFFIYKRTLKKVSAAAQAA